MLNIVNSTTIATILKNAEDAYFSGRIDESERLFRQVHANFPASAEALRGLGLVAGIRGDTSGAMRLMRESINADPTFPEGYNGLGNLLNTAGQIEEATQMFRRAIELRPTYFQAFNNLGNSLREAGRIEESVAAYRQALKLNPSHTMIASNLLYTSQFLADRDEQALFAEHKRWNQNYAAALGSQRITAWPNEPLSERRLRIGYVSPDFRTHSVAYFIENIIEHHDRSQTEIYCYADEHIRDKTSESLQSKSDHWRTITGISDAQVVEMIRADRIDILVDLAGHTALNRLMIFSHHPAPVQVTYLGYPDTTGIDAIEYRLTDSFADPIGTTEMFHTEELVRLPGSFLCYRPPEMSVPVRISPSQLGAVAFGGFNALAKCNPRVISLWSKILLQVPGSRFLMKSLGLRDLAVQKRIAEMFIANGITPDRLDLRGSTVSLHDHFSTYNQVDIALDTFPYNGATTTCEALWMGVPVITLAGKSSLQRVGVSLLHAVGGEMTGLIANDEQQYLRIACDLANNPAHLNALRTNLRTQMQHSSLMNGKSFTLGLKNAYRTMWQRWCQKNPGPRPQP